MDSLGKMGTYAMWGWRGSGRYVRWDVARAGGSGGPMAEDASKGKKMDEGSKGDGTRRRWDVSALQRDGVSTDED
jgi:hypothetical protein